jgi:Ca-activated chloride channel family protein
MNRPIPLLETVAPSIRELRAGTVLAPDATAEPDAEQGFGALRTSRGCLPLAALDVMARVDGLLAQVEVAQRFVNDTEEPLEATYIFPLLARAGVNRFRMEVGGRTIEGRLEERGAARKRYQQAIETGHRAAIAEEERPEVFTLRVGNLMPGESATVRLTLSGMLPYVDGEVTFRFPLVVAPRYIPGRALPGGSVGSGTQVDTTSVPDASRITPPVLLPGFPSPVQLAITVDLHEGLAPASDLRSSLHAVVVDGHAAGVTRIRLVPGEKLDRDFILRYRLGGADARSALTLHPDVGSDKEGTFALTLLPPDAPDPAQIKPRDIAIVLDRSGSMQGWKIVAARRAVAGMIETLGPADRFAVLAFNNAIESPWPGSFELRHASDPNRVRAASYLQSLEAREGTEMAPALEIAARALTNAATERRRILVLVTDGQVGNEDEILRRLAPLLSGVRVFALGIDQVVNAGFLKRLADLGEGDCELVESAKRLDEVTRSIHRRIAEPLRTSVRVDLAKSGLELVKDTMVPDHTPDLFPGTPVVMLGRYRGRPRGDVTVRSTDAAGRPLADRLNPVVRDNPAIEAAWARGLIRQLEDRFAASGDASERQALEGRIVAASLRHGVLCRFTAYTAIDHAEVVNPGGEVARITQPVEMPVGLGVDRYDAITATGALQCLVSESVLSMKLSRVRRPRVHDSLSDPTPSAPVFFVPDTRVPDRFENPRVVGHGGMGRIYVAFDRSRGRMVQIKLTPRGPNRTLDEHFAAIGSLTGWSGSAVLGILEVIKASDHWIVVSEVPAGKPMERWLSERGGVVPPREAARIVAEVAEAFAGAHAIGAHFTHLCLGDLHIGEQGRVLLDASSLSGTVPRMSRAEAFVGEFSPPERFDQQAQFNERTEVYLLGALLHRLVAGPTPVGERWFAPRKLDPHRIADPSLAAIQAQACAANPNDRIATVAELAARLRAYLGSGG